MVDSDKPTRRDVVKGAAAMGAVGLAGCSGGGDGGDGGDGGGDVTVTIGGTSTGSSTQAAGQALARAASQHSDFLNISVQETQGWTANLYEYDNGQIPAMGVDNNSLAKALSEEGPFADDPVDTLPNQGFLFTSLQIHWVGLDGSDVESVSDLREGGYTIYPIQPGFGTRLLTEEILKEAGLWEPNEIINANTSDIPGAVEEGRVDALCVYGANGVELSSWVQEVDVRSGGALNLMEVDQNFEDAIDATPGALKKTLEPYGWEQDVTGITDTTTSWVLAGQWAFGPDVPAAATEEVARLSAEHGDAIRESDPTALDHSGVDSMTEAVIPELEVHPGVADYWEANDAWNDEWTRGETNE